jgi:alkaline phosphatase
MHRGLLCGAAIAVMGLAVFTGGASASGPAPPGKQVINLTCVGIGPVTVSVARGNDNTGAGQLVGRKGHGIPVRFTTTVIDVTKSNTVLSTDSSAVGHGHAHRHQTTTTCSGVVFSGPASTFFGNGPLPPGVDATDTIEVDIVVDVIAKL